MLLIISESGSSCPGSFGSEWFAELSRVAVVPADLKTLQPEQTAQFSQGFRGLVLVGQDFFMPVVYPFD